MKKNKLKLDYKIDTVFLISENIVDSDISLIRSFFNCNVSSFFGHSERLIFAPSFSNDLSSFQIDGRYGLFELLDNSQNVIDENDSIGEMVGTSFDNYAMPLIRYRTNDMTSYQDKDNLIIDSIEGRWKQEYLSGNDGTKSYLTALNMHSDIFKNVIKYQFLQTCPGSADLCIRVNNEFIETDKKMILDALNKKSGHIISFKIKMVDNFRLTHRGKFINIVKEFQDNII